MVVPSTVIPIVPIPVVILRPPIAARTVVDAPIAPVVIATAGEVVTTTDNGVAPTGTTDSADSAGAANATDSTNAADSAGTASAPDATNPTGTPNATDSTNAADAARAARAADSASWPRWINSTTAARSISARGQLRDTIAPAGTISATGQLNATSARVRSIADSWQAAWPADIAQRRAIGSNSRIAETAGSTGPRNISSARAVRAARPTRSANAAQ
jgi:hypothetical protein